MIEKEKHNITPKTLEECDKLQCKDCSLCNEDEISCRGEFYYHHPKTYIHIICTC